MDVLFDLTETGVAALQFALVALAVWLGWKAMPYYRCLTALQTAPLVTVDSGASGIVKIKGAALPAEVPEGFAAPKLVWCEESTSDARPGHSSGTRSVAQVLVRDATGECLVRSEEAMVLPSGRNHEIDSHIFGDDRSTTTRFIRNGDQVFAIGTIGRAKERPGQPFPRCSLHRSPTGVLLLSGASEAAAARGFRMRVYPALAAIVACVGAAGWIWWIRPLF